MRRIAALVSVVALLLGACAAGGRQISGDGRNVGAVTMTFRVDPARVRVGQAVELTIRLVNNSGRAETLRFPSGQRYDFWALRDGREVWRWSEDQIFSRALETERLGGQTGVAFSERWRPEEPGRYEILGELHASGYDGDLEGELVVE